MSNPEQVNTIKEWLGGGSINLFGLPFAGKDSQGKRLADTLGWQLIGGGQILRESVIPPNVKADLDAGILVPTDEYMRIVLPYLSKPEFTGRPLILSAVGRWDGEQEGVVKALEASGHPLSAVVSLVIPEDEARRRWQEHEEHKEHKDRGERRDDAAEILDNRFSEFHAKTKPVLDYYDQRNLLIEVNGEQSRDDVADDIITRLAQIANRALTSQ